MFFPICSVPNFYDDPQEVRKFALSLKFAPSKFGEYPGLRTQGLHEISESFVENLCTKFFSMFYNLEIDTVNWEVSTYFQLIHPNENSKSNVGWIHKDDNTLIGGVIYLSPGADKDSGTSLFRLKPHENDKIDYKIKCDFNQGLCKDTDTYIKTLTEYNDRFIETHRISNDFNTMIAYPGDMYHRANSFDTGIEPRLTQVFFINRLVAARTPLKPKS